MANMERLKCIFSVAISLTLPCTRITGCVQRVGSLGAVPQDSNSLSPGGGLGNQLFSDTFKCSEGGSVEDGKVSSLISL